MTPDDPRHGTYAGGRVHRADGEDPCQPCRDAEARYEQARVLDHLSGRPRMIPSLGTQRRIRALVALGHSFSRIAEALGDVTPGAAWALAHRMGPECRATTAATVASLYDAWSMTLPPAETTKDRKAAAYARTIAAKHRWLPPLAWDDIDTDLRPVAGAVLKTEKRPMHVVDDVVVERALGGEHVACNIAERRVIVAAARAKGWPLDLITTRTGITKPERYLQVDDQEVAS